MMKRILMVGSVLLGCWTSGAAPLQRADVAASPWLVAHIDFDALRATGIGKAVLTQLSEPDVAGKLDAFQAIIGCDPRTQFHGLTCYTTGEKSDKGVLIIYADFDSNRLVALAGTMGDYQRITNGSHIIHTWTDEKKKAAGEESLISATIVGKRVIFGQSEAAVAGELDVLDGKAPNLENDKEMSELWTADGGNFLQAMVNKFDFVGKDANSAILRGSKVVRLNVGETGEQLKAMLNLEAGDPDKATQIASIAQGLLALGKLQQDKPALSNLASTINIKLDGRNVMATLSIPESDAMGLIETAAKTKKEPKSAPAP
jgi:hypothetical protein